MMFEPTMIATKKISVTDGEMSGRNDGSDIIRGPCLDNGLGKYSGVGNARCAHNYYHKIKFAVFRDPECSNPQSVQIKTGCPVSQGQSMNLPLQ